jgi:predicted O-methyltransferase YrrM
MNTTQLRHLEKQALTIPDALKAKIEHELRMEGKGIMEGWVDPVKGVAMAELVIKNKPEFCVEIGVFGGRSLIATALACKENQFGKVYGIDPWKTEFCVEGEPDGPNKQWWASVDLEAIHHKCMEAIWRLELDKYAIVIRAPSGSAGALFRRIDMLTIDGNHSEVASCRDVEVYCPRLRVGAPVVFDDADWPSTQKAQQLILKYCDPIKDFNSWKIYVRK